MRPPNSLGQGSKGGGSSEGLDLKLRGTGSRGVLYTEERCVPSSSQPPLLSLSLRGIPASLKAGGVLIKYTATHMLLQLSFPQNPALSGMSSGISPQPRPQEPPAPLSTWIPLLKAGRPAKPHSCGVRPAMPAWV